MHPSNPYFKTRPDFARLASLYPTFAPFVTISDSGYASIDFQDAAALRALTTVLLKEDWGYDVELREDRLCPTHLHFSPGPYSPTERKTSWLTEQIANRLDYLYHILDIESYLTSSSESLNQVNGTRSSSSDPGPSESKRRPLRVLDIGTGHIAIYPLLLHHIRPDAEIIATELDAVSFHHSLQTRIKNNIPHTSISIRRPTPDQPILFPLFDSVHPNSRDPPGDERIGAVKVDDKDRRGRWDFVICNPPFFGSEAEMKEGRDSKVGSAPAGPTAAVNELITPGGEVDFVGQMITESLQLGETCLWYTSLIGKYSSLSALVDQLKRDKVDNYFIKICRQSRTTRWILGWSHTSLRLPDSITRPDLIPGTSFARLLPPPNTFSHTPINPTIPISELKTRIEAILAEVSVHTLPLDPPSPSLPAKQPSDNSKSAAISIAPHAITWSRAARRQAARAAVPPGEVGTGNGNTEPLFRAEIHFVNVDVVSAAADASSGPSTKPGQNDEIQTMDAGERKPTRYDNPVNVSVADISKGKTGGKVELRWTEGRDRIVVESLWKFILSKANLVGGR